MNRSDQKRALSNIKQLARKDKQLHARLKRVLKYGAGVRSSEYHLTNACNLRCKGCWYFTYGHDAKTQDVTDLETIRAFAMSEQARGVNSALLIGGEPTLFPERIRVFQEVMDHVTISTNGVKLFPYEGFEKVAIGISLFGGGSLDDELRGFRPGGSRLNGLLDRALANYRHDPRVGFIYAVTEEGIDYIEPTVRRIRDNGNRVTFNFYSKYDEPTPIVERERQVLLETMLRVQERYPDTVMSHPYYIHTLVTGESHWARFGFEVCPSVSADHSGNASRIGNGNPTLPQFNAYASDLKTLEKCCTSGHCSGCRDSQAVQSWLLVSLNHFAQEPKDLKTWVELAESYWSQFVWSPYNKQENAEEVETCLAS